MATWTIANLERNVADGGVTVAHWRVTEEETVGDVTYTASAYGTCGLHLTPLLMTLLLITPNRSTVLGWVHAEVDQSATEAALTANIEGQKTLCLLTVCLGRNLARAGA